MKISNFELKIYFDWIFPADYPHQIDCYLKKVLLDTGSFQQIARFIDSSFNSVINAIGLLSCDVLNPARVPL